MCVCVCGWRKPPRDSNWHYINEEKTKNVLKISKNLRTWTGEFNLQEDERGYLLRTALHRTVPPRTDYSQARRVYIQLTFSQEYSKHTCMHMDSVAVLARVRSRFGQIRSVAATPHHHHNQPEQSLTRRRWPAPGREVTRTAAGPLPTTWTPSAR